MTLAIVLMIAGLLMVFLEFFVPGGILGVAGTIFLLIGFVFLALHSPSWILTLVVGVVALTVLVALMWFALYRIRHAKTSFYLSSDQEGFRASVFAQEYIGKEGIVDAVLRPSGHILIEGERLQAVSKMGFIEKGAHVVVIGGEGAHLVVRRINSKEC